jgi:hypothetical protein
MSTLIHSFPIPHFYLGSLNFYWLKSNRTWFFLTKHYFSFRPFFLFPKRLYVLKHTKSLRKSVRRSLFISVLRLFLAPPVLPGRTSNEPTAHIIVTVLRLFPARLVLSSCASTEPTADCKSWAVITVRGFIRSCYETMTYQHFSTPQHINLC